MPSLAAFSRPYGVRTTAQQVQCFGGASAYSFGLAVNDTTTPDGHSFSAFPSDWPMQPGTAAWFGVALPDGNFAFASMTLPLNEVDVTMYQTSVFIWNTTTRRLQCIAIPTSTGVMSPPWSGTTATGSAVDALLPVTLSGTNYLFGVGEVNYSQWQQSVYGQPYVLWALKEISAGNWAFDSTHSWTAEQLAQSSAAGASTFPTTTNSYSETVYQNLGAGCLIQAPVSGHLIIGNYFYASGTESGILYSVNPTNGVVEGSYQFPNITDVSSVAVQYSIRDLDVSPIAISGDERFIVIPDVYNVSGGADYGVHPVTEMSYNGSGTFTVKSPPMTPYTLPTIGYTNSYNLAHYDSNGNLWLPTHGGQGLAVFNGHETHVFLASGHTLPTLEDGGPAGNWYSTQFPASTQADFRFGAWALSNGLEGSLNYDSTRSRMVLTTKDGTVIGGTLAGSPALGPQLAVNGTLTSGTTGWNGFFTSTLAVVADASFASGECLELTSSTGTANIAAQGKVAVIPYQNYILSCQVKAVSVAQTASAQIWWYDANGNNITDSVSPTVTESGTTITYIELFAVAPANATTAFLLIDIAASSAGEQHKVGSVSWKSVPITATPSINTNHTRLLNGNPNDVQKGDIIGSRLYYTVCTTVNSGVPVGESLPQWLMSVDLTAL